jgi:hypothetical protein
VVPGAGEGTFRTLRFDRGTLERVEGRSVFVKEDDGAVVEIVTTDDTVVTRDGERAEPGGLRPGDHIRALRVKEGESFVARRVAAISPERWEQRQERRAGRARPGGPSGRFL